MKYLFMFIVVFPVTTVLAQGASAQWRRAPDFGQYSNIRDRQFRILNGISVWSNYWDAARNTYVCKAEINFEKQGKNGFCFVTEAWVEKDKKVVECTTSFMLCLDGCKTADSLSDAIAEILVGTNRFIDRQDGCPLIASTPNVSYRGDSAKRIKELFSDWCVESKGFPREIGFEWRHPTMYTLMNTCFFNLFGAPTIVNTVRVSDIRIEFKGFAKPGLPHTMNMK